MPDTASAPFISVANWMPDVWVSYTCQPCCATVAIGGEGDIPPVCPVCGLPMVFLGRHQAGAAQTVASHA